ncbi:MAG TPA: DUF4129 domain-containing protein [Anaeromyxobacter sp.]|nr:DUF4129 domain-containing protein [Anaeromyxobacter sp.]
MLTSRPMAHLPGLGALLVAASLAPAELRAKAQAVLASGDYQASLPKEPTPPKPFDLPLGPLALLLRILLWTALAVAVVLAVSWLVRRLAGGARDAEVAEPAAEAPPEIPIASAEALAREGRWAEAIHALLLETLQALSRAARLAPSLTSREIVASVRIPARARDALQGLVLAVEISRFGGAPAAEGDYRACLSRFHAFLDTYRSAA